MSNEAVGWVFNHSPYTLAARLVHLAIADVVNDAYEYRVFIGDATIAAKAKVDRRTVTRVKAKMIADGYLVVLDDKVGPGKYAEYRFVMENMRQIVPGSETTGDISSTDVGHLIPERGTSTALAPITNAIEPKGTQSRARTIEQDFEITWNIYPRKLNRKGALRAYQARRNAGVTGKQLWDATKHYATTVAGKPLDVVMHGATFYGPNDRWQDYLAGPLDEAGMTADGTPPTKPPRPGRDSDPRSLEELLRIANDNEQEGSP